jgi:hypothetical protein
MQYEIPSRSFNIKEERNPIEVIYRLTRGFNSISHNTERDILSRICNRKKPTKLGRFTAPHKQIAKKINGTGGYFLKKTTYETNIDLIWYDDRKSEYLFWGSNTYNISNAMSRIRYRILKHIPAPAPRPAQRPCIADTPPPRDEEPCTQKIFCSLEYI